jgi:serine/threonine-protein kinase RsbW
MKKPMVNGNTITIPSKQEFLPEVDEFIESRLKGMGIEKSVIADIAISTTEMVINCIVHGNKSDESKNVMVDLSLTSSEAKISITDEGGGFNPENVESPIEDKNLLKEVGRGIFITKSLMDSVVFESTSDGGTRVILTKHI